MRWARRLDARNSPGFGDSTKRRKPLPDLRSPDVALRQIPKLAKDLASDGLRVGGFRDRGTDRDPLGAGFDDLPDVGRGNAAEGECRKSGFVRDAADEVQAGEVVEGFGSR